MNRNMRTWIKELESAQELYYVDKLVNPLTQMGELLSQSKEKALFFQKLVGFPGWRTLGNAPANLRHAALAFECSIQDLIPTVAAKSEERLLPVQVDSGPVKDVILQGNDLDLTNLPVHIGGEKDAGPFIASGLCVTKNPDSNKRNFSFHRLQLKGPNKTGFLALPRHTRRNMEKYKERGEPMPIAIFIGHHIMYYMAAAMSLPYGVDEFEVAGAFLGHPVELVPCETVPLEVPSDAEIVLEGYVYPDILEEEGPYSESHDYYVSGSGLKPIVEYTCLTKRTDAIYMALQNGSEMGACVFHKVPMSASLYSSLRNVGGFTDIKNVLVLPGLLGVAVQMVPKYYGEAKTVLLASLSSRHLGPKVAIAIDEDVDIFEYWQILWSISTRVNPEKDIIVIPGCRIHPMDLSGEELYPADTPLWSRVGGKVLIDATKPPLCDVDLRAKYERIRPMGHGQVKLEDFIRIFDGEIDS